MNTVANGGDQVVHLVIDPKTLKANVRRSPQDAISTADTFEPSPTPRAINKTPVKTPAPSRNASAENVLAGVSAGSDEQQPKTSLMLTVRKLTKRNRSLPCQF